MRKSVFLFLLLLACASNLFAQQVVSKKTILIPGETGIVHSWPRYARNTNNGQTLVVWQKVESSGSSILGRILNRQGGPATSAFVIVAGPRSARPSVVFNPVRNEYLLAYDDNPEVSLSHSEIVTVRLDTKGKQVGTVSLIAVDATSAAMVNFYPVLNFNRATADYSIIWLREVTNNSQQGNNGLVGTRLNATGGGPGNVVLIRKAIVEEIQPGVTTVWDPIPFEMATHPTTGKIALTFVQRIVGTQGTQLNYHYGLVNSNFSGINSSTFKRVNSTATTLQRSFSWGLKTQFLSNGTGVIVFTDTSSVKRRRIDATGKLAGPPVAAFKTPQNNKQLFFPDIAFVSTGPGGEKGALIAIQDPFSETGGAMIWVQPLDSKGAAVGTPKKVETTASTQSAYSSIILPLPQKPNVTLYKFAGVYIAATFTTPGQTVQAAGLNRLGINITFP